ncbi:MAG: ribosome silencing factor [Bacteroidales bacterium]|nr:ribosome silencing factor [Bacteroidales bacterium]
MKYNNKLIKFIIDGILEKKGKEIIHINLEKLDYAPCENFIICHGDTGIQSKSLAESVEKKVKDNLDIQVWHREGVDVAKWILLDYGFVVVHIFQKDARDYYKLEELWGDAELVIINDEFK